MPYTVLGLLFIIFLVLKLAEVTAIANWSWWAVFAPLIAQAVIGFIVGYAREVNARRRREQVLRNFR